MTGEKTNEKTTDERPPVAANLSQRILWIRDRVRTIGKDSEVRTGGGSYKAISHDKVTGYIRPKMVQAGIVSHISCIKAKNVDTGNVTKTKRKIFQHQAVFEITFLNVENQNDYIRVRQVAYADDFGDKAPGKATSYAMKYALLKMFMIETGEEDEERIITEDVRGATVADDESMMLDLWAVAEESYGGEELAREKLESLSKRRFHVDNYGAIPQTRMADAVRSIRQDAKKLKEQK